MSNRKTKQEILDDISKKEFFDEQKEYSDFFMLWYDGLLEDYFYDFHEIYFHMWLEDQSRLRDDKIDEILDLSKKNRLGDFFPKDFDN